MMPMARPLALLVVLVALAGTVPPAASREQSFSADYSVTLLGLPIARARFDSTFTADRFTIDGSLDSAGLARIFDRTTGTTRVEGTIGKDGAHPRTFHSRYDSGRKKSRTTIRFARGSVASFENTPEPKRGDTWIPVARNHLRAALDPLTSTLIRTSDPDAVCNRTIRVFDGEMRADLRLSPRGAADSRGRVTCDARFVPVSGYRKGRKQIDFLQNESRITITFAPLGSTGFFTPVDASVGTQIGPVRITARRIEAR
jgi:hypothetical protein